MTRYTYRGNERQNSMTTNVNELIADARRYLGDTPMYADASARMRSLANALEAEHAEVQRLRGEVDVNWPCDGGCNINDGPEETCSRHGRRVSEVWQMQQDALIRAERAEEQLQAIREVVTGWNGFTGLTREVLAILDTPEPKGDDDAR